MSQEIKDYNTQAKSAITPSNKDVVTSMRNRPTPEFEAAVPLGELPSAVPLGEPSWLVPLELPASPEVAAVAGAAASAMSKLVTAANTLRPSPAPEVP